MPKRSLPRTIDSRLSALRTAKERKDATLPADVPMMPTVQSDLDVQLPLMVVKNDAVNLTKAQQTAKTAEVAPLRQNARTWVNHGFQALINATIRGEHSKTVLSYYGLDNTAKGAPDMGTEQSILDAHAAYGAGEIARIAAGGLAIPFPSGIDIDTNVNNFRTANLQQAALKDAYDNAQEDLQAFLPDIDQLILKMWNGIEANFDTGDKPSLRRKAREWGVVYLPSSGEEPTPDDYSIVGKVTDAATGNPFADVELTIQETGDAVTTDANGDYFFGILPDGVYTVLAHKDGLQDRTLPGVSVTAGTLTTLDIQMSAAANTGTVSGNVTQTGTPVMGATITVEGQPLLQATTDINGNYTLNDVPEGAQQISAQLPAPAPDLPQTQAVTVMADMDVVVDFNF